MASAKRGLGRLFALCAVLGLVSCGGGSNVPLPGSSASTVIGTVLGGGTPVSGSTVVLWESTATGSLAIAKTTTGVKGNFSLSYTNPDNADVLYVTAYQGDAGYGTNDQIQMASDLGIASSVASSSTLTINELTTAAFALSFGVSYDGSYGLVGASQSQDNWAQSMVDPATGTLQASLSMAANGGQLIETLDLDADILAACYQTNGTAAVCGQILGDSDHVYDMFLAAVNWATNSANVNWSDLYTVVGASPPYDNGTYPVSALTGGNSLPLPPMVTLSANGVSNALVQPSGIAIDGQCDVWIGSTANPSGYLTEIQSTTQGVPFVGVASADAPNLITTDGSGGIDYTTNGASPGILNLPASTIATMNTSGSPSSTTGTMLNGTFSSPITSMAYDGTLASTSDYLAVSMGGQLCTPGSSSVCYTVTNPGPVAVDSPGDVFVADMTNNAIDEIDATTATSGTGGAVTYSCSIGVAPSAMAVDSRGHVWVASSASNSVTEITSVASCTTTIYATTAANPAAFNGPDAIAVDGSGNIWVANAGNDTVTRIDRNGNMQYYSLPAGSKPVSLAVDPMGNLWVADNGANAVTALFGVAAAEGSCTPASGTALWSPPTTDVNWNPTISSGTTTAGGSSAVGWLDFLPMTSSGLLNPY